MLPIESDKEGCIYIIYTPNLGFPIAVFGREREQGRFRGSKGEQGGACVESASVAYVIFKQITGCLLPRLNPAQPGSF